MDARPPRTTTRRAAPLLAAACLVGMICGAPSATTAQDTPLAPGTAPAPGTEPAAPAEPPAPAAAEKNSGQAPDVEQPAQDTFLGTTTLDPISVEPEVAESASGTRDIKYFLERVEVSGNTTTASWVVRRFVPLQKGDVLDVDDPDIEAIRWHLLGTGWFDDVQLRLKRGAARGWVVLSIQVRERNTLVIQQLAFGAAQGVDSTKDKSSNVEPYFGATVAETNLLGLGKTLSVSGLVSERQQGLRVRFVDPVFLGSSFLGSASLFINNGREFFGNDPLVSISCPPNLGPDESCPPEVEAQSAVVLYQRAGLSLGTGHDLGPSTRYTLDWQGEFVDVDAVPDAASEMRGNRIYPIDFAIERGESFVSALRLGVVYDRRDDPGLTSSGVLARFQGDLSSSLMGSDYRFLKLQLLVRSWHRLPWAKHYVRLGLFAGFVSGRAPFFYRFYASDLSDLIPSRVLDMSVDNRPPPNLFDTAVGYYRVGDVAGRADVEYGMPLLKSTGFLRRLDGYVGAGVYGLAPSEAIDLAPPGYSGVAEIPFDFTFDLGLRADTTIGVLEFGFSGLLGFFVL